MAEKKLETESAPEKTESAPEKTEAAPEKTEAAPEKTESAPETKDDRVELFVPKGYANDEPNLFIAVNGKTYLLPKGKTSKVPPFVKAEFDRAQRAQAKMDEHIDQMLESSK